MKLENGRYDQDKLDKNSTIWSLAINDELLEYHQNYSSAKKMTAQEMFKKLGYKVRENEDEIYYYKDYDEHEVMMTYWKEHVFIQFVKPNGSIVQNSMHCGIKYYHKDDDKNHWYETLFLSKKELQAINQQCKELEWI